MSWHALPISNGVALVLGLVLAIPTLAQESDTSAEDEVRRLVDDLDADEWDAREAAVRALAAIGEPAIPVLREAASGSDPEVAWRAARALERIATECTVKSFLRPSRWEYSAQRGGLILLDPPLRDLHRDDRLLAVDGHGITKGEELQEFVMAGDGELRGSDVFRFAGIWPATSDRFPLRTSFPPGSRQLTLRRDGQTWVVYLTRQDE